MTDIRQMANRRYSNVIDPEDAAKSVNRMPRSTPQGYYIIIGRGPSAVVNHTTLRQSAWGQGRLGSLPVLHIGFEDPWTHYKDHLMGQFPHLLGLPGFANQPKAPTSNFFAPEQSQAFADRTTAEMARLAPICSVVPGWVAFIQPQGTTPAASGLSDLKSEHVDVAPLSDAYPSSFPPYRLLIVDTNGKSWLCYAEMVDICTGSGRPRITTALAKHRSVPWSPPETWPAGKTWNAISSGTEALYREAVWAKDARVCVMGSAGVAVNVVERSEADAAWVDWLAQTTLHLASFANQRNDHLLKHSWSAGRPGNRMTMGEFAGRGDPTTTIDPALDTWRFGSGCDASVAASSSGSRVRPTFFQSNDAVNLPDGSPRIPSIGAEIRDYWGHNISLSASSGHFPYSTDFLNGHSSPPSPDLYDHVIFCRGQDPKEIGQPSQIASLLGRPIAILASTDHRVVGVQYCNHASCGARERDTKGVQIVACDTKSCSAKIRVLGVAGNLLATMVFDRHTAQMKAAEDFQLSLPAQARFPGHTLCCTDAAEANRFFDAAPNTNVNTMSLSELESVLMDLHLAQDVDRARRIRPFGLRHSYELEHELRSRPSKQLPVNWRALISKLTYGY